MEPSVIGVVIKHDEMPIILELIERLRKCRIGIENAKRNKEGISYLAVNFGGGLVYDSKFNNLRIVMLLEEEHDQISAALKARGLIIE